MKWRCKLEALFQKNPRRYRRFEGATQKDLKDLEDLIGCPLDMLDPTWIEMLRFSNGMKILGYSFYSTGGHTINTISFKTIFLWEVNDLWKAKMYLFMGISGVQEYGILSSCHGRSCVAVIKGSGHEEKEVIPIASSLAKFLENFANEVSYAESKGKFIQQLPSLATWPPDVKKWYSGDVELLQLLQAEGSARLREIYPESAEYIWKACQVNQ